VQIGKPDALYTAPMSAFVANFIGENNALLGTVERSDGGICSVALPGGARVLAQAVGIGAPGSQALVAVRPECIAVSTEGAQAEARNRLAGTVRDRIYLGDHLRLLVALDGDTIVGVKVGAKAARPTGETVTLTWAPTDCRAFPAQGPHS
jgi:putative spermidine/putrescine transport system ATP-binding protein